jgi:hypothetical protein
MNDRDPSMYLRPPQKRPESTFSKVAVIVGVVLVVCIFAWGVVSLVGVILHAVGVLP